MRILHFYLGPYRRGGLNLYVNSLAIAQQEAGHKAGFLYPYGCSLSGKTRIRRMQNWNGVTSYAILNAPPVPLFAGIREPEWFLDNRFDLPDLECEKLLSIFQPEILHIHTWMGFPRRLLKYCREHDVKTVFTTHDYFGLCPKVNFINSQESYCPAPSAAQCAVCNADAPSRYYLLLRNSPILLRMSTPFFLLKHLLFRFKRKPVKRIQRGTPMTVPTVPEAVQEKFRLLLEMYRELFQYIDCIHFNSSLTETVYSSFLPHIRGERLSITHSGIHDNRRKRSFQNSIRIGFIGSTAPYKGFPILKQILEELEQETKHNWTLEVWGSTGKNCGKIHFHGTFQPKEAEQVYGSIDLLVLPAQCKETFSFVILEALSFGVPTLITSNVGARDIVMKYAPDFICSGYMELKQKLKTILTAPSCLQNFNSEICRQEWKHSISEHQEKIMEIYQKVL